MKLIKMLANLGYGSRKDIKKMIKDGLIKVNGNAPLDVMDDIEPEKDVVEVLGQKVYYNDDLTILLNKPSGYLSSNKDEEYPSVLRLIEDKFARLNLNIAGRLDQDSEGMLILSNNGPLIHQITSPKSGVNKTYYVELALQITETEKKNLSSSMALLDSKGEYYIAKAKEIKIVDDKSLYITISEGKFHQVKKMVEHVGNEVTYLRRVSIGKLELGDLKAGEYKVLSQEEILLMFE